MHIKLSFNAVIQMSLRFNSPLSLQGGRDAVHILRNHQRPALLLRPSVTASEQWGPDSQLQVRV